MMSGGPQSHQLSHFMAGVFPLCTFLHVPGKMSRPYWLSLGTAFLLEPPTNELDQRTKGIAFLTAAHTLLPWAYFDDKALKELKIPEDLRRSRFVIGRVYLPDESGNALKGSWFPVKLSALHPTLDVGLLSMGVHDEVFPSSSSSSSKSSNNSSNKIQRPTSLTLSKSSLVEADRFRAVVTQRHLLKRFKLSSRNLSVEEELLREAEKEERLHQQQQQNQNEEAFDQQQRLLQEQQRQIATELRDAAATKASIVGFRAKGLLGTLDTMDPRALDVLEPSVKAKLLAEMNDIEGRQEAATVGLKAIAGGQRRFVMGGGGAKKSIVGDSSSPSSSPPLLILPPHLAKDDSLPLIQQQQPRAAEEEEEEGTISLLTSADDESSASNTNADDAANANARSAHSLRCASVASVLQGAGYHGMSGSPVVVGKWWKFGNTDDNSSSNGNTTCGDTDASAATPSALSSSSSAAPPTDWCIGVLHGASADHASLTGTLPAYSEGGRLTNVGESATLSSSPPSSSSSSSQNSLPTPSAGPSTTAVTPFVSYIPSDAVLEWLVRDLSHIAPGSDRFAEVMAAHDPLRGLVARERKVLVELEEVKRKLRQRSGSNTSRDSSQQSSSSAPSSAPSSSRKSSHKLPFVDPVTDDMLKIDDEDAAWIAQIRAEKQERLKNGGKK